MMNYEVMKKLQLQLIGYFLGTDRLKDRLVERREFMDSYFRTENCACLHLAHMVYQNEVAVKFDAYPIDWKVLYELTYLLREWEDAK